MEESNCKKKVTAAKDPFSASSGIYKQDKLKGQKTCPFCFSTNKVTALNCINCNGILKGVPVTQHAPQPDAKKQKKNNIINVHMNNPINVAAHAVDSSVTQKIAETAMEIAKEQPINSKTRLYSDPNVDELAVDDELATQIEDSANNLAIDD